MTGQSGYAHVMEKHLKLLSGLRYESGLFAASRKGQKEGYDKAWLRDNFYECLAFEATGDLATVQKTYHAILDIFRKHEYKIDYAIIRKPEHTHEYIHPRYHPETFEEYWEEWGNKQNDSVGCILFKIGELEKRQPGLIVRDAGDRRILQKLVWYLATLEYWSDPDSGMWEENEEVHASSIGACVAGLKALRGLPGIEVAPQLIDKGEAALRELLPRESAKKFVDLAQLSLIWPYAIALPHERQEILKNVEYHLVKDRGVIRYKGDRYFNGNADGYSEEAEWTFGLAWLSIIYWEIGDREKARAYATRAMAVDTDRGMPELYYSNSNNFNENTPLGWSESLLIVALNEIEKAL